MLRLVPAAILVVIISGAACAQNPDSARITIPVLIEDSHHNAVTSISRESLVITQNKDRITEYDVVPTTSFPLRIGILLDVSASERGSGVQYVFKAARDFAKSALRSPDDRVFFGAFNVKLLATPWLDREAIERVAPELGTSEGTAIYDAVLKACELMMRGSDGSTAVRHILVVISDGDDNASYTTSGEAAAEAVRSGTVIFGMTTFGGPTFYGSGEKHMEQLAELSGGETVSVPTRDAPKAFARITDLMKGLYFLTYTPIAEGPKRREVEVKSTGKERLHFSMPSPKLKLRARGGPEQVPAPPMETGN